MGSMQEARPLSGDVVGQGGSFEGLVRKWVQHDGHLEGTSATIMASVSILFWIENPCNRRSCCSVMSTVLPLQLPGARPHFLCDCR